MPDALHTRFALPDDPDLDAFSSGSDEVDSYFRSRQWFNTTEGIAAPPTYQFLDEAGGEVLGYASVDFRSIEHPHDDSDGRARYLVVYAVGLHKRFQGQLNPRADGKTYAMSVFHVLEGIARRKERCIGISLWVRNHNSRAMALYEKIGFRRDPGGPVFRDGGPPHLTMRKPL